LFVLAPASRIRAISSLLYRFFFIDLSFPLERSYDFRWYDFRASGHYVRLAYIPSGCLIAEVTLKNSLGFMDKKSLLLGLLGTLAFLASRFEIFLSSNPTKFHSILFSVSGIGAVASLILIFFSAEAILGYSFVGAPYTWLQWIGNRGFSIYLLHGPISKFTILSVASLAPQSGWLLGAQILLYLLCLTTTLFLSNFTYRLIEVRFTARLLKALRLKP